MTNYINKKYSNQSKKLMDAPEELRDLIYRDAQIMKSLNIDNDYDFKDFVYISSHTKFLSEKILQRSISVEELAKVSSIIYENKNVNGINSIINFYFSVASALNKANIPIKKIAYPQGVSYSIMKSPHNIDKWLEATKKIYLLINNNDISFYEAFDKITSEWDAMEKLDFKYWLSFYQQDGDKAYKKASYYDINNAGTYVPMNWKDKSNVSDQEVKSKIPQIPPRVVPPVKSETDEDKIDKKLKQKEEQDAVAVLVKKIIGRLNSAEKLITDVNAAKLLGKNLETWLSALQSIKRMIQVAPFQGVISEAELETFHDLLIKKSNQIFYLPYIKNIVDNRINTMYNMGLVKSASYIRKYAQDANIPDMPPPADMTPPMDSVPEGDDDADAAMEEFIKSLNEKPIDIEKDASLFVTEDDEIIVTAQEAMPMNNLEADPVQPAASVEPSAPVDSNISPEPSAPNQELNQQEQLSESTQIKNDDVAQSDIERALANITINDIIKKLEGLASIFKNREIARQLAIVDLMMDAVGIASFFPNLAEATNKALESNQYVLTRIEDILARLRGTEEVNADKIALEPTPPAETPVQKQLAQEEALEKARKEQRKEQQKAMEDAAIQANKPQESPIGQAPELAQPANIEESSPTPPPPAQPAPQQPKAV